MMALDNDATPSPLSLMWVKRSNNAWCRLLELDLDRIATYGVYVMWHGGYPSRIIRVGHGDIATELRECCGDRRVTAYQQNGPLFVTWAAADAVDAPGIHLHLADRLRPLIEDGVAPRVVARAANSPF